MPLQVKQAFMRSSTLDDEEGLTMEQREEQAEKRFKAIAKKVVQREGLDKYEAKVDYVSSNRDLVVTSRPEDCALKRQQSVTEQRKRQIVAKMRKALSNEEKEKFRVL